MRLSPRKPDAALEGVHGPKNFIEQRQIVRGFFKLQKIGLDGLQMFFGFRNKVGKKFRIEKVLAHTHTLVCNATAAGMVTCWFPYRLTQQHLYVADHFFGLGRFDHIQIGAKAHAGLDIFFLPLGGKDKDGISL